MAQQPWELDKPAEPWNQDIPIYTRPTAKRRVAAFTHGTAEGVARLVGLPVDTVTNALNLALAGYGTAATAAGRPDLAPELIDPSRVPMSGESLVAGLNKLGISTENPNVYDTWSRALNFLGLNVGASVLPTARTASLTRAFQPGQTAASSVAGGGAAFFTEDPALLSMATMLPAAPSLAKAGTQAAFEATPWGKKMKETVPVFRGAGTSPTVAQATDSHFFAGMEALFSKLPFGGKPFQDKFARQLEEIQTTLPVGSAERAGRAISRGSEEFLVRTSKVYGELDQTLQSAIGQDARIAPENTIRVMRNLAGEVTGGEGMAGALRAQTLEKMYLGLLDDVSGTGDMPVAALRRIRSMVGARGDRTTDELVRGELDQIYGAISEDLKMAALRADGGTPGKATAIWERQNRYWRARQERVNWALDKVLGKNRDKPADKIFLAAAPKSPDEVVMFRQVMRSLQPDERRIVADTIVDRLGRTAPEGDLGAKFSAVNFLRNWRNLNKGARRQLIPDDSTRTHLDNVSETVYRITETTKTGERAIGRFGSLAQWALWGSVAGIGAVGGTGPALMSAIGGLGTTAISSRLMANKRFVEWLAGAQKPVDTAKHMARLAVIYEKSSDQVREDLTVFIDQLSQSLEPEPLTIDIIGGQQSQESFQGP